MLPDSPRENFELIGHEWAEARLLSSWQSERMPHAWLFSGPRGIGKATLAHRLARFALCPDARTPGGERLVVDPSAASFKRVVSGGHSDLMVVECGTDPETGRVRTSIGIDAVRRAGSFLGLTAGEGGWRVVIVDGAETMSINAANALLKILEEPPDNTLLILVTHSPHRLPVTIRSRCCQLQLRPLNSETVETLLAAHFPDTPEDERCAAARLAEGSIGRAVELIDNEALALYRSILELCGTLPHIDGVALHGLGDRLARREAEQTYRTVMELLQSFLSRLVRQGTGVGARGGEAIAGEQACAEHLLGIVGLEQWCGVWEKISRLIVQADRAHLERKQVLLNAFYAIERAARA